jgi:hypothetical protein
LTASAALRGPLKMTSRIVVVRFRPTRTVCQWSPVTCIVDVVVVGVVVGDVVVGVVVGDVVADVVKLRIALAVIPRALVVSTR